MRLKQLLLLVAFLCVYTRAEARLVTRTNSNTDATTRFLVLERTSDPVHSKQWFVNNLSKIQSVAVYVGDWNGVTTDYVTLKIAYGTGAGVGWHYWGGQTITMNPELKANWVTITLAQPMTVTYGEQMIIEVTTNNVKLGYNRDRYPWGRRVRNEDVLASGYASGLTAFQDTSSPGRQSKKEDLMFTITGLVEATRSPTPQPTTNITSPYSCVPVYDTERAPNGSPANALNVMFRELNRRTDGTVRPGSFYTDDINALKAAIKANLLEGPANDSGMNNTPPWSTRFNTGMNFYIAREDPSWDPELLRGFMRCANIDIIVDIATGAPQDAATKQGSFQSLVHDPRVVDQRMTLMHELAHAVGGIHDEYTCDGTNGACLMMPNTFFSMNTAPLGSGTNACADPTSASWCTGSHDVSVLRADMAAAGDPNQACWAFTTQAQCATANCHYIGGLGIAYFGSYTCVPRTVVHYNIGTGCNTNSGCYPGAATNSSYGVSLNVAQPSIPLMQTNHQALIFDGYGGALAPQLDLLFSCAFATDSSCATYPVGTTCAQLQDKWDGGAPNASNLAFLGNSNACASGINRRR